MPDFMQEWWFLGLMTGLLCLLVLALPVLLLVVLVVLPRYRRVPRPRREVSAPAHELFTFTWVPT